jgi:hypothetical protein
MPRLAKFSDEPEVVEELFVYEVFNFYIDLSDTQKVKLNAEVAMMKAEGKDVALLEELISTFNKYWELDRTPTLKLIDSIANRRRP